MDHELSGLIASVLFYFASEDRPREEIIGIKSIDMSVIQDSMLRKILSRVVEKDLEVNAGGKNWILSALKKGEYTFHKIANSKLDDTLLAIKNYGNKRSLSDALAASQERISNGEDIQDVMNGVMSSYRLASSGDTRVYHGDSIPDITPARVVKTYPWHDFNNTIGGLHKNELLVIGGRPSHGKSSFLYNIIQDCIFGEDKCGVLMFTPEVTLNETLLNMACLIAEVDTQKIQTMSLDDNDMMVINNALRYIRNADLWIVDEPAISAQDICTITESLVLKHPQIKVVAVDYIQLLKMTEVNPRLSVSAMVHSFLSLKKRLDICLIVASQITRVADDKWDHPTMSMFKESGSIEEQADMCMLIVRPSRYEPDSYTSDITYVHVLKNRNGVSGNRIVLSFDGTTRKFLGF